MLQLAYKLQYKCNILAGFVQVCSAGLGSHTALPVSSSLTQVAGLSSGGENPWSHWKEITAPSSVLEWGAMEPLAGGWGAPQSTVYICTFLMYEHNQNSNRPGPALLFIHVWLAGSGLHRPSAPHTATRAALGNSAPSQRNVKVEFNVVFGIIDSSKTTPLARIAGPQSTVYQGDNISVSCSTPTPYDTPASSSPQLWFAGSGLHWPSAPHTASCVVFGKSPSAQRNEKVEPTVVLGAGGSTTILSA